MGLKDLWQRAMDGDAQGAEAAVKRTAAELAARQALAGARAAVAAVGAELLDDAEELLADETAARAGQPDVRPDAPQSQSIADRVLSERADVDSQLRALRARGSATPAPDTAADRRAKALAQLAALKAKRDAE